jgi:hypothetical protein
MCGYGRVGGIDEHGIMENPSCATRLCDMMTCRFDVRKGGAMRSSMALPTHFLTAPTTQRSITARVVLNE